MVDYTLDPNMGFKNPIPTETLGPIYAQYITDALTTIGAHTHLGDGETGPQITPAAININGDLSWNSLYNINNLRTTRYTDQTDNPDGVSDVACVYFLNGDLWINNGSGSNVQITDGTEVNTTTGNTIYALQEVAGNWTIVNTDTYVVLNVDTNAARTITLPSAAGVSAGRYYIISDKTGLAITNPITINKSGIDTIDGSNSYVIRSTYGGVLLYSNGVSQWNAVSYWNGKGGNIALGTAPARSGSISLSNNTAIKARNAADSADVNLISLNGSNNLFVGDGSNNLSVIMNAATAAFVKLQVNSTDRLNVAGGSIDSIVNTFNFYDTSGTLASSINSNGAGASNITWASAVTPTISQTTNTGSSAVGKALTIQAQSCSGTTSTGGNLVLKGGTGTSLDGYIYLNIGGVDRMLLTEEFTILNSQDSIPLLTHERSSNSLVVGSSSDVDNINIGGVVLSMQANDTMNIIAGSGELAIKTNGMSMIRMIGNTNTLGFYNATPVAKQTGVAVSAAGIHAALVNLGLIS